MGITRSKPEDVLTNLRQAEAGTDPYIDKEPTIRKVSIAVAQMACSTDRTDEAISDHHVPPNLLGSAVLQRAG